MLGKERDGGGRLALDSTGGLRSRGFRGRVCFLKEIECWFEARVHRDWMGEGGFYVGV